MHPTVPAVLLALTLFFACTADRAETDATAPAAAPDTLTLRTEGVRGDGLFSRGAGFISFEDTAAQFPYSVVYPAGLTDIGAARLPVEMGFEEEKDYIDIIGAKKDGQSIVIVDENDNQDFSDDPVRPVSDFDIWNDPGIAVSFTRTAGDRSVRDSSWIRMGTSDLMEDMMLYGTFQHRQSDFNLGSHAYRLGVMDNHTVSNFGYGLDPELALLSVDGEERDTLERREYVKHGEYLHLAGHSYRFDSITPDGGEVFLVRDDQFAEREGTQVGMLAPEFKMVTTEGDTVNSTELHDKPIVVANSCGCGGDTLSPRAFSEIREAFADRMHTIRLDSKISDPPAGWNVDVDAPYNEDIYRDYRGAYCSRIAYLVGEDRRVLDQFEITDWENSLPERLGR